MARTDIAVIDGDGHLLEDLDAIAARMPPGFVPGDSGAARDIFPPKDHLHAAQPVQMLEGSFERVGPDGWLGFLDDVGIACAALYPTWGLSYGFIVNPDWAIAACRAYNDWLFETYLKPYNRFIGMGLLPLQEPASAVEELHRVVSELGMSGAVLPSTGLSSPLGSAAYWPVYDEADRLGCTIAIHGGQHVRMGLDHLEIYAAVNALGHPFGQLISFASLLVNGVFDRTPRVRFAFLEGGVTWPLLALERLSRAWETHIPLDPRQLSVALEDGERIDDHIRDLFGKGRIYVGCEGDEPFLPELVRAFRANPAVYSTDFPHETNRDRARKGIQEIAEHEGIDKADRLKILSANAAALYGLSDKRIASLIGGLSGVNTTQEKTQEKLPQTGGFAPDGL